ncbi:MAG TPA: GDYXXLXY domain-containing protein [Opitutaceae bacterium]|nr:GDYXXLXY domain-containing protein [Opitutaceae bacterium]
MKRWLILGIAVAQLGLLAFMAGQREWVLRTGRQVWLRTAPVDPTDPMRGAYVRLGYEFSTVKKEQCRDGLVAWFAAKGPERMRDRVVYAVMKPGPHGLAEFVALTDRRPAEGLYLRGRADSDWSRESLQVRYGLEALFLQQDHAKALEVEAARQRWTEGRTIDAKVAVGTSGISVLAGYRWAPLGVTLETELGPRRQNAPASRAEYPVVAVNVTFKNHGEQPVALWLPADPAGAFRLVPDPLWGVAECRWNQPSGPAPVPQASEVRRLAPGEEATVRLDLARPEWLVVIREKETGAERSVAVAELGGVPAGVRFLFEYVPPAESVVRDWSSADRLWLAPLRTPAFYPRESRAE